MDEEILTPAEAIYQLIAEIDSPIGRRKYSKEAVESAKVLRKWAEENSIDGMPIQKIFTDDEVDSICERLVGCKLANIIL